MKQITVRLAYFKYVRYDTDNNSSVNNFLYCDVYTVDTVQDSFKSNNVTSDTKVERTSLTSNGIVHKFGIGTNPPISVITLIDLLLFSFDKGLNFNASEKGKKTYQNFECYSGHPPVRTTTDDQSVRNVINMMYTEIDIEIKGILSAKRPSIDSGDVTAWNRNRKGKATVIQERVMKNLEAQELAPILGSNKKTFRFCTHDVFA